MKEDVWFVLVFDDTEGCWDADEPFKSRVQAELEYTRLREFYAVEDLKIVMEV